MEIVPPGSPSGIAYLRRFPAGEGLAEQASIFLYIFMLFSILFTNPFTRIFKTACSLIWATGIINIQPDLHKGKEDIGESI